MHLHRTLDLRNGAPPTGEAAISTQVLPTRGAVISWAWVAAIVIPVLLLVPAIWNGYPLLEYDTGGYLARWYEGYLVPSRSTVYRHLPSFGTRLVFLDQSGISGAADAVDPASDLARARLGATIAATRYALILILATALPWLASMLLTDIFAGLAVLALFILVVHNGKLSTFEKITLFLYTSFAAATHSATFGVLFGLCCLGWLTKPWLRRRLPLSGLLQGSVTLVVGAPCCWPRISPCQASLPGRRVALACRSAA